MVTLILLNFYIFLNKFILSINISVSPMELYEQNTVRTIYK